MFLIATAAAASFNHFSTSSIASLPPPPQHPTISFPLDPHRCSSASLLRVSSGSASAKEVVVMDSKEEPWTLRYYTRPGGNRASPVFTVGWLQFVRAKRLQVGDELTFDGYQVRADDGELQVQYRIQVTRKSIVTYQGQPVYLDVENFL
ncbi:hypothetical protein LWI29_000624 [Acer saccharum]|uniref:TF-B3 domain-containing protein n=1 Tax=Acer saccharum TaxID=4024 RepID=A0AA39SVP5_ACESA|nr:hypothetical protein LWI29_000624 [Acer saccharum]